jgi:TIGR03009 family protein
MMGLAVLLLTGACAPSQTPPPANNKLDGYLKRWEQEMRKVQALSASLSRTDKDKVFGTTARYSGWAQYLKSGSGPTSMNLAAMELKPEGKTEPSEKLVCTGTYLYVYKPAQKEIHAYEMPRPKPGQVADDGFLGLLFGMKGDEARKRYTLQLTKEDKWYIYVDIAPRNPADKGEFARARLVLNKDNFLPRQLWFEHANGNEVTWDIPRIDTRATLDRRTFDAPRAPTGWKLVPATRGVAPTPRVIRQNREK